MELEGFSCVKDFILSQDTLKLIEEESLRVSSKYVITGSCSSVENFRKHLKEKIKYQYTIDNSLSQPLSGSDKQAVVHCHSGDELPNPQSTRHVPENSSDGVAVRVSIGVPATMEKMGAYQNSSLPYNLQTTAIDDTGHKKDKEEHMTTNHVGGKQEEHTASVGDVRQSSIAIDEHNCKDDTDKRTAKTLSTYPLVPSTTTTSSVNIKSNCPSQPHHCPGILVHTSTPDVTQRWNNNAQFKVSVNHQVITQQPTVSTHISPAIPVNSVASLLEPSLVTSTFPHNPLLHNPQSYTHAATQEPPMLRTTQPAMNTSLTTSVTSSLPATFNNTPFGGRSGHPIDGCIENRRYASRYQKQMIYSTKAVLPNNYVPDSPNAKKCKGDSESFTLLH